MLDPARATWRKSSYSGNGTPNCIEAAATWRTSSYSGGTNSCVEVADNLADRAGFVLVRDTKDRTGPVLRFPRHHWEAFTAAVRADEFG